MRRLRVDVERERIGDRDLAAHELGGEGVLLEDLGIAPAARSVELGDDDAAAFEEDLEDAVLVGVELDQPAVAAKADTIERVEHGARREVGVGHEGGLRGGQLRHRRAANEPARAGAGR